MTLKIAFLGLGAMGSRMAANLIKAGFDVAVWNRTAARADPLVDLGAKRASSPLAAAEQADVIISMVRDDEASFEVWLNEETGALPAMQAGSVAIECSTLTIDHVRSLADAAKARGVQFLDAPLAGSRPQAEAAQLIFLVGGTPETLSTARPVLDAMGSTVHHAGAVGAGAAVKLAVNALLGIQAAAMAELIGMFGRNGVTPESAVEILGAVPVTSPAAKATAGMMLSGAFPPMFPVDLVEKDFGYIEAAGDRMPISQATRQVMRDAMAGGYGDDNFTGILRLYQRTEASAAAE